MGWSTWLPGGAPIPNCTKIPTFNTPGKIIGMFCKGHTIDGMIDVKHKRRAHPNCTTRPTFNTPDQSVGMCCQARATEGMVDVMSRRCVHPNCTKHPTKPSRCFAKSTRPMG